MNYKIVACDLDGTLLNNQSGVDRENLDAISELSEKGVLFVPSSGRTFSEIPAPVKNHPDIRYFSLSNGAVVYDRLTGQRMATGISRETGRKILDALYACETHVTMRHGGECYVDAAFQSAYFHKYYNLMQAHCGVVRDYAIHREDFRKFCYEADGAEVFSAFFHDCEEKIACKRKLEQMEELRIVEADEYNLEIFHKDAGKGNALMRLAQHLGIDPAQTMAVGDSDNDASMIQAAGLGLAMSNACDSLKQAADLVICSNEDHVVPYLLNHYFM